MGFYVRFHDFVLKNMLLPDPNQNPNIADKICMLERASENTTALYIVIRISLLKSPGLK